MAGNGRKQVRKERLGREETGEGQGGKGKTAGGDWEVKVRRKQGGGCQVGIRE